MEKQFSPNRGASKKQIPISWPSERAALPRSYSDKKRREATLYRMQQLIHDKAMVAPIVQVGLIRGYGARVEESGLGLMTGYSFSAPTRRSGSRESRREEP
jgi:hypothetical protein